MGNVSNLDSSKITFLQKLYNMGFRIDNESVSAVGFLNGYRFTVSIEGFTYMVSTSVRSGGLLPEEEFLRYVVDEVKTVKDAVYQNNRVTFIIQKSLQSEKMLDNIINSLHEISDILKRYDYVNVCEICGQPLDSIDSYDINGRVFDFCENCHEACESYVQARKCLDDSVRENIPKGMALSLLGGIVGAACIVASVALGSVSTWLGAVLSYGLLLGYEKGSGKMSRLGLIFSAVMTLVISYFSCRLAFAIRYVHILKEYGESASILGAFSNLHGILGAVEGSKNFVEVVLYCCVFGSFFIGADLLMMVKKRKTKTADIIIEIPEERHFYTAI